MGDKDGAYLRIKVDGPTNVSVDTFRHVVNGMSEIASEVDRELDEKKRKAFRWDLTDLEYGSATLVWKATPTRFVTSERERAIPRIIREGISAIQSRQKQRPKGYSDKALRSLRGMIMALPKRFTLLISDERVAVNVDLEAVAQIDEWLQGRYEAFGSVEGRLDRVSSHNRLEFTIYDDQEHKIDCFFPDEMKEKVKTALYGDVSVQGRIVYRADGVPVSVFPSDILPITYQDTVDLRKFIGVLDLDMRSEDYVRSLRDE